MLKESYINENEFQDEFELNGDLESLSRNISGNTLLNPRLNNEIFDRSIHKSTITNKMTFEPVSVNSSASELSKNKALPINKVAPMMSNTPSKHDLFITKKLDLGLIFEEKKTIDETIARNKKTNKMSPKIVSPLERLKNALMASSSQAQTKLIRANSIDLQAKDSTSDKGALLYKFISSGYMNPKTNEKQVAPMTRRSRAAVSCEARRSTSA